MRHAGIGDGAKGQFEGREYEAREYEAREGGVGRAESGGRSREGQGREGRASTEYGSTEYGVHSTEYRVRRPRGLLTVEHESPLSADHRCGMSVINGNRSASALAVLLCAAGKGNEQGYCSFQYCVLRTQYFLLRTLCSALPNRTPYSRTSYSPLPSALGAHP